MHPFSDDHHQSVSKAVSPMLGAGAILSLTALLYGYTLAPTLLWGDDAMYQWALAEGSLTSHPVWGVLARVFARLPCGDFAFRANLASAVYALGAIGFLYLSLLALGGSARAALAGTAILSVSHAFWLHAVRAEVYTLHMLLFFGGLWSFLRWRMATTRWLWLVAGLAFWLAGTLNHLLLALALPGGLCLLLSTTSPSTRRRAVALLIALLAMGTALVAIAIPSFLAGTAPRSVRSVLTSLTFSPLRIAKDCALLVYQFPLFGILAVPGFRHLKHRHGSTALGMGLVAVFTATFAATFDVPDAYVFYLPVYGLVALCCGLGADAFTSDWPWARWLIVAGALLALQIGLYRATPLVLDRVAPTIIQARDLPGRPANTFFLWPSKRGYVGARWYAETVLDLLPPNAILMVDHTPNTPIQYLQAVEGRRPDVVVVYANAGGASVFRQNVGRRPLFLADDDPRYYPIAELTEGCRLESVGPIFEVLPNEGNQ